MTGFRSVTYVKFETEELNVFCDFKPPKEEEPNDAKITSLFDSCRIDSRVRGLNERKVVDLGEKSV